MAAEMNPTIVLGLTGDDQVSAATRRVNHDLEKVSKTAGRLNGAFRGMRGGAAQLGYQIQDVAVQLQGGQNALLVFGQQGSQVASLMGPGGALIGAVIAVGAALATTFTSSVDVGIDKLQEMKREFDDFVAESGVYTKTFQDVRDVLEGRISEKQAESLRNYKQELVDAEERLERLKIMQRGYDNALKAAQEGQQVSIAATRDYSDAIKLTAEEIVFLRGQIEKASVTQRGLENTTLNVAKAQLKAAKQREQSIKWIDYESDRMMQALIEQDTAEKKRADSSMKVRLANLAFVQHMNDSEMRALIDADIEKQKLADKDKERQKATVDARLAAAKNLIQVSNTELNAIIEAEKRKQEVKQKTSELENMILQQAQNVIGQLMAGMDQQSGAYKALFAIQQGIAIASTIINTEMAAIAAMAPPPIGLGPIAGPPYATAIRALGYASVGIIAGQTLASFEGGGITFNGVRSGGLDGKGGRMAVVHPNEKITDLEKDGSSGASAVNINFNIQANDARGFDELLYRRRGMIASMVNQALNDKGKRLA